MILRRINDPRIYIENKPLRGIGGEICIGCSPDEFDKIFQAGVVCGCVLDFGHAVYAACSLDTDPFDFINLFMEFNPILFHLSDGYGSSETDMHLNLGIGDLDIQGFFSFIPDNGMLTLETPHDLKTGLDNFARDIYFLHKNINWGYFSNKQ